MAIVICILIILLIVFLKKNSNFLNDIFKKSTTNVETNINILKGYKLLDKSYIDYSKKLEGQRSFNMFPIEKSYYKEFNLVDFEKDQKENGHASNHLIIKIVGNVLNIYGYDYENDQSMNSKKILLLSISNYNKILYSEWSGDGAVPIYNFIVYYNDNLIKIYNFLCDEVTSMKEVATINGSKEKLYVEGDYSEGLYNLFLKKDNGDYYSLMYKTTYAAETIKNAILFSDDYRIYVTKENDVYFLGNKLKDVKFLAAVGFGNVDINDFNGIISTNYRLYYLNYDDDNSLEDRSIKNLYYRTIDGSVSIETYADGLANLEVYVGHLLGNISYFNFNKR